MYEAGDVPCLEVSANRTGIRVTAVTRSWFALAKELMVVSQHAGSSMCAQTPQLLLGVETMP